MNADTTADTVTRAELADYLLDNGMDLRPFQLDALWAFMALSSDKEQTIQMFIRLLLEDGIERMEVAGHTVGFNREDPWL